jgi:ATP-dependent Lon protease
VIEIPGYTIEEKETIGRRHVIPKELKEHGLKPTQLRIDKAALKSMLQDYAREPGLRSLQQQVGRICRKAAARIVADPKAAPIIVRAEELTDWLGPKRFHNEVAERITVPGVVVGLAWTAMGGDILFIEATELPGSGGLKLTGQMGEVMTESASIAWTWVKKRVCSELKLDQEWFKNRDFHLHIPAGAIPKDGPSAGITMATALYSLLTGRVFRQKVAMTGELSLVGKVLPIGGIKEKILAARRAGITTVILPRLNQKDMSEVPAYALQGMEIRFVSTVDEVFDLALEPLKGKVSPRLKIDAPKVLKKKTRVAARTARRSAPARGRAARD